MAPKHKAFLISLIYLAWEDANRADKQLNRRKSSQSSNKSMSLQKTYTMVKSTNLKQRDTESVLSAMALEVLMSQLSRLVKDVKVKA